MVDGTTVVCVYNNTNRHSAAASKNLNNSDRPTYVFVDPSHTRIIKPSIGGVGTENDREGAFVWRGARSAQPDYHSRGR